MSTFVALSVVASARAAQSGRTRDGLLVGLAATLAVLSKASGVLLLFVPVAAWLALSRPLRRGLPALAAAARGHGRARRVAALALPRGEPVDGGAERRGRRRGPVVRVLRNLALVAEWFPAWWTLPLVGLALAGFVVALGGGSGPDSTSRWSASSPWVFSWSPPRSGIPATSCTRRAGGRPRRAGATGAGRPGIGAVPPRSGRRPAWVLLAAVAALALVPALRADFWQWTDPSRAPMPGLDRLQFVDGWPSGYGVVETVAFVKGELARHPAGLTVVVNSRAHLTTRVASACRVRRVERCRSRTCPSSAPTSCRFSRAGLGSGRRSSSCRRCRKATRGLRPHPGRRSAPRSPSRRASRTATSATRCIGSLHLRKGTEAEPGLMSLWNSHMFTRCRCLCLSRPIPLLGSRSSSFSTRRHAWHRPSWRGSRVRSARATPASPTGSRPCSWTTRPPMGPHGPSRRRSRPSVPRLTIAWS